MRWRRMRLLAIPSVSGSCCGCSGIGGVYDLWRRARAILRQERFRPEHGRF